MSDSSSNHKPAEESAYSDSGKTFSKPTRYSAKPQSFKESLQLALWFFKAYPLRGLIVVLCLIFSGIFEGIGIAALLPLFNLVIEGSSGSKTYIGVYVENALELIGLSADIPVLLSVIVLFITAKSLLLLIAVSQAGYSAAHITKRLRLDFLRKLAAARWDYFASERMGNITAALTSEAGKASGVYLQLVKMLAGVFHISVYFGLALLVSPWVTLAGAVVGILTVILLSRLVTTARDAGRSQNLIIRDFTSRIIDGLSAFKPIKAMGQEQQILPLLENDVEALNAIQRRVIFSKEALKTLHEPIIIVVIATALYFTIDYWHGEMEALFAIIILFQRTVGKINAIQSNYQGLVRNEAGYSFVQSMISKTRAAVEIKERGRFPTFKSEIRLKDVCFSYDDTIVFSKASMVLPAREFVAVTGPSGAGKTTCADLIIGLMQPNSGDVEVDGVSLKNLDMQAWRHMIGYVPQETLLFHDTIHANVTLGDPTISSQDVKDALRRASALEFVNSTTLGLESVVGEHGLKFSGGQRQRIAIARALVRNPKLLILDEATTSLDPENEEIICDSISKLAGEITILAISHQRALVEAAHIVYRVENRKITNLASVDTLGKKKELRQRAI